MASERIQAPLAVKKELESLLKNQKALQKKRLKHVCTLWYGGAGLQGGVPLGVHRTGRHGPQPQHWRFPCGILSWFSGPGLAAWAQAMGCSSPQGTRRKFSVTVPESLEGVGGKG